MSAITNNASNFLELNRIRNMIALAVFLLLVPNTFSQQLPHLAVSTHDITTIVGETKFFYLLLSGQLIQSTNLTFKPQHDNIIDIIPESIYLNVNDVEVDQNFSVRILGKRPGQLEVTAETNTSDSKFSDDVYLRVTVANAYELAIISVVFGWIYFVAWSVSFYPQIYENFRRKSVIGLNFDFLSLNIVGFILYSVFNAGLFWSTEIQAEYSRLHPRGLNPVLINDIFFSFHAIFATSITIIQCFLYERGNQRVSITARSLLGFYFVLVILFIGLSAGNVITWLDFLYYCSYIKLSITLIKYIPQAVMNYRRKSTIGWSIGNILLDFTGGMLSMLQMIVNAYNYDDWESIFGDPTKFGLGLFSVCFDILFMLQHFVFYRRTGYFEIPGSNDEQQETPQDVQNHQILAPE